MKEIKKIRELVNGMNMDLKCQLHNGKPRGTCWNGFLRDLEELKDVVDDIKEVGE